MKLTRLLRLMPLIIYCSSVLTVELWAATSEWVMYSAQLCVQVKVGIEAKKEEKSGDIRWGHDHRELGTTWQLHIVSIPNSSQEEHLVIFFQCNFMVQLKSAQTEFSHELCFGWQWSYEVNFLWVLSFAIRKLALSFSPPTRRSFMTTASDTKHNLCRLVKSMIIRDGSLSGVLLLETMWDHLAILFPALTYVPSLLLILFKNQSLWSDNQFHWIVPNFPHFPVALTWGWNKDLSKARA